MKKVIPFLLVPLLLTFVLPNVSNGETQENKKYVIFFDEKVDSELLNKNDITILEDFTYVPAVSVEASKNQMDVLKNENGIRLIQEEKAYKVMEQSTPWAFEDMNLTNEVRSKYKGTGIKVAVLDTGIDSTHPDLNVVGGTCALKINCNNGFQDDNGHGTHVAGIIAALNNRIGMVGVAPNIQLYGVKVLDYSGLGTTTTILTGIEWALENDMDILNLSFTTPADDPALKAIIDEAYRRGLLIVAAAGNVGNSSGTGDTVLYPAKYSSVIGVAGVDKYLQRMKESSSGSTVEVSAPGKNIISTIPLSADIYDGVQDGYAPMSGTSMATPYVTGLLALYKEKYPNENNETLRNKLVTTTLDLGENGRDPLYGFGLARFSDVPVNKELPSASLMKVENSEIEFQFDMDEDTDSLDIYENKKLLVSDYKDNQYFDYRPKGNYQYEFHFNMDSGETRVVEKSVSVFSPYFQDLKGNEWYAPHMMYLNHQGILNGVDENVLKPNLNITRGQAVAILGRAIGLNGDKRKTKFTDVGNQYFASGYIQSALEKDILQGFPDGSFRPEQYVSRAEMAILLANAYHLSNETGQEFNDVNKSITGYQEIYKIANQGITEGYPDGNFKPHEKMTRANYSVFISRAENSSFLNR
ncbi:S8 family peptidase [Bacillus seohaeanensis]|uniref:S8 family serine peptidase n=1 Tax=Bacillus seohaeanensis TaxID=284580 RepID=A0ABW5RX46_9BACI